MDRVALDLGFFQIYWYSIMIVLGMLFGMLAVYMEVRKHKIDEEFLINLIFYTVIWAIIGARIYYVVFNFDYYSNHLFEIFEIWNGGLAIHGGILFGTIYVLYKTRKEKSTLRLMDIFSVGLILGQAIGRWGNFFNQEAFGSITTRAELLSYKIPEFIVNGMYIDGAYYHPCFLYESIWNLLGFIVLVLVRKFYAYLKNGQLTGLYLVWYSAGRFFIESMRADSLMLGSLKMAQIASIVMALIGLFLILFPLRKSRFKDLYKEDEI